MRVATSSTRPRLVLEAALLAAEPTATAFGLLRFVERTSVTTTTTVVAATTAAAAVVVAIRGRTTEVALLTRRTRAVFSDIEPQVAATNLTSVELLDGLGGVPIICEPNECEASRASTLAVLWNVNVNDLTDLTKELTKLLVRRGEVEVPYEYLA